MKIKHFHCLISRWCGKQISMQVGTLKQSLYNERKAIAPKNISGAANFLGFHLENRDQFYL